jgi:type II secretory pathway pseudopilin PulG
MTMRAWWKARFGGGAESGLTMIEVLVAAVVLVLGAAATFGVLGAATRNAQRAKATQVALDLAQEELERLNSLPYDCSTVPAGGSCLAINRTPESSTSEKSPGFRVHSGRFALKRSEPSCSQEGSCSPLVVESEKGFSPESSFQTGESEHGGIHGTIYRYVVWRNDPNCTTEACEASEDDYKQIVVAVKPDTPVSQRGETGYVEVQSAVTGPPVESPEQLEEKEKREKEKEERIQEEEEAARREEGGGVTAQQFFLSDTPCAASGTTERVEIAADHPLHNTLGTCASGLQTGTTLGAPDALLDSAPPDPYPEDESKPPLYDYSDDYYLEPTLETDKGLQIRRDDTSGCHYDPTGTTDPAFQVHRWVTDPMPHAFQLSGRAVLELYTRALNDALYTGRLCVYLFERSESGSGKSTVAEDTMLVSKAEGTAYWTYEPEGNGYWPRNSWTNVRLTMEFQNSPQHVIPAGNRLGLALSVDRADTSADAIPIMYDHPNYPSRLEVDTKTPIEGTG